MAGKIGAAPAGTSATPPSSPSLVGVGAPLIFSFTSVTKYIE